MFAEYKRLLNICYDTNSKIFNMFDEGLFLESTANKINLNLIFEVLYRLSLYCDVVNRVLVFFQYVSDILCSYVGSKIPCFYTLVYEVP